MVRVKKERDGGTVELYDKDTSEIHHSDPLFRRLVMRVGLENRKRNGGTAKPRRDSTL